MPSHYSHIERRIHLTRFVYATHGIENVTLFLGSQSNQHVLRVYPQKKKSNADILLELDFMSHLRKNGLPLPAITTSSDNEPLVIYEEDHQQWQCVLMEYVIGSHPDSFTQALLDHMALLQARMHLLGEEYATAHNVKSGRTALRASEVLDELLKHPALLDGVRDVLERIKAFVVELDESLPQGFSHFDFDIESVLTMNDHVTAILDFGDLECLPLVVCRFYCSSTLFDHTHFSEKFHVIFDHNASSPKIGLMPGGSTNRNGFTRSSGISPCFSHSARAFLIVPVATIASYRGLIARRPPST